MIVRNVYIISKYFNKHNVMKNKDQLMLTRVRILANLEMQRQVALKNKDLELARIIEIELDQEKCNHESTFFDEPYGERCHECGKLF